jgi:FlaA1/EpsC-like NDP-sugar epimerase
MNTSPGKRILIVGAGEAGRMVAAEIANHPELDVRLVGFLDDDPSLAKKKVANLPVLGRTIQLEDVVRAHEVDEVIIAVPTAPGYFVRCMVKHCHDAGVPCKIVPGVMEIIKGDVRIEQIREVRVEDLMGRETVDFNLASAREILAGKVVLVTGAGGSIGSELCRQIARVDPKELVLLGRGENRIFDIEEELRAGHPGLQLRTYIADLRERGRTVKIVSECAPDVIYHAAAHKHVHYMERDPAEAVINNIGASVNLIEAAEETGVSRFVFISTDKAANPRGVMGATKRLVELYLRSRSPRSRCRFITVRFGNVIGSTGSVVPLFLRQIRRGGPVTVSDPRATRYFMTVKEAALLVIRASMLGTGGETFILDMGEPVNILEMAQDVILLAGYEPETEIPVVVTGLRDGEKLSEELVASDERLTPVGEEKIMLAEPATAIPADLEAGIDALMGAARKGHEERIIEIFSRLIPGFAGKDEGQGNPRESAEC